MAPFHRHESVSSGERELEEGVGSEVGTGLDDATARSGAEAGQKAVAEDADGLVPEAEEVSVVSEENLASVDDEAETNGVAFAVRGEIQVGSGGGCCCRQ